MSINTQKRQRAFAPDSDRELEQVLRSFRNSLEAGWDLVLLAPRVRRLLRDIHKRLFDADISSTTAQHPVDPFTDQDWKRFSEVVGTTVGGYIDDQRIGAGAVALVRSSAGVGRIALALGYHSSQAFSMAFRRRMGCPPSQYRIYGRCAPHDTRVAGRTRRPRHEITL